MFVKFISALVTLCHCQKKHVLYNEANNANFHGIFSCRRREQSALHGSFLFTPYPLYKHLAKVSIDVYTWAWLFYSWINQSRWNPLHLIIESKFETNEKQWNFSWLSNLIRNSAFINFSQLPMSYLPLIMRTKKVEWKLCSSGFWFRYALKVPDFIAL